MTDARQRRLMKEIRDCARDASTSGITIRLAGADLDEDPGSALASGGDISHLIGVFKGPESSPYEGGIFEVDIVVPPTYPFQPLKMKFITKTYHPNVSSQSGAICLDILKDAWTPVLTLKTALVSLQSLLCSPEPNDPQDAEVAKVFLTDRKQFDDTAKYWTTVYAGGDRAAKSKLGPDGKPVALDEIQLNGLSHEHVKQFVDMGFEQTRVIQTLAKVNYRGNNATNIPDDTILTALLE
ncbi:uncharacterized protein L969DRAFT_89413 [Mixia osmundae IAM 14324]|uniref:Ubiquitin-conjugating enzyme E2 1 n=1 Tax=Mixia osmundae (strain CBS 9802 / IAM 14324 / JCM 22182 / KY 12970) TaxID=764103 RepID=G7DWS8_MIXOS|nr:uncharacterized protein L969DRAFT_91194 [Mixia osmundae IAM 14324]XP_014566727.1 uncharacterized protein L969DRAFT_89413 [Mixia osmundae IAM 14324]KEI36197.1 hypothetical protein L969DRAFT_91194 [Mixia osmundae IAM 14324]KEI38165.1 hypothetical protein L969DRAFT_89413 [Mixia osmundae IAM 14324]GAA95025.1 hypothetical protein E5Q_01680 [Mixia osmundae IAM 14324]